MLVRDADNLGGAVDGFFELNGRAKAAGYLAAIPAEWQEAFGAEYLTGWSSVNSIIPRYSVGPTLWTFDPQDMVGAPAGAQGPVATTAFMNFSYGDGHFLADDALVNQQGSGSPVWNHLSQGVYGFIVPGTRTFAVFGSSGSVESGVGYKITQDNGITAAAIAPTLRRTTTATTGCSTSTTSSEPRTSMTLNLMRMAGGTSRSATTTQGT